MSSVPVSSVYADTLYDGLTTKPRQCALVTIDKGEIVSIVEGVPLSKVPDGTIRAPIAAPGLIDLQINGAGDVQFNFDLSISGLEKMVAASARGGAAYIFPTFTTAPDNDYRAAVEAVKIALNEGVTGIAGIHLEGPFISGERPGIHRSEYIRTLAADDVDYLCSAAVDLKIILTIAPERQNPAFLKRLSEAGIVLFAGHSNATFEEVKIAKTVGLSGATHLFNAMSQATVREPGLVGTVLGDNSLYAGIIADGHHVHTTNLRIAARAIPDRLYLVTDAMQTMNGCSKSFELYGKTIKLKNGILTGPDGTLGGAHLTMADAVRNMVEMTGIGLGEAIKMASGNPARAAGLGDEVGKLVSGTAASMTFFTEGLNCIGVAHRGVFTEFS